MPNHTQLKKSNKRTQAKIAYIGGGSRYWARDLMKDLSLQAPFDGEISLYDLDYEAARKNVEIGNALFGRSSSVSKFKVKAVKNIATCLKNADFVVLSIEPGLMEYRYADLEIPLRYGIVQPVGDTTGPGGILRSLRMIPIYEQFAHDIMKYCPHAWVINYTNPMSLCIRTLYASEPKIKAFGCCHEVFGSQNRLAGIAKNALKMKGVSRSEVKTDVSGINHFTWITQAKCRGEDLMPLVRKSANTDDYYADATKHSLKRKRNGKYFENEGYVAFDLMRKFGALAAAGDRHLVEFVPWYAKDIKSLHRWGVICTPYKWRIENRNKPDLELDNYSQKEINPTGEEGVKQMAAILGFGDFITNVNMPNRGQAPDLKVNAIVETNAAFRKGEVVPTVSNELPKGAQCLVNKVISVQEMTLEAAMNRDLNAAKSALMCDPLVNTTPDLATQMFDEMCKSISDYLAKLNY